MTVEVFKGNFNWWSSKSLADVVRIAKIRQVLYSPQTYGKDRRNKLLKAFKDGMYLPVNVKHCISLKKDPDLQKLLKKGLIKQVKDYYGTVTHNVLVVNDEKL